MPDTKIPGQSKHYRSFWPIIIILSVTLVLCGLILSFAQNNIIQDEIDSSTFAPINYLRRLVPATTTKTTTKKSTTTAK